MQLKTVSAALSKEEVHLADEHGNFTRTWARLELGAELEEEDDPAEAIGRLKEILQTEVDDWLLFQGGYIAPPPETEQLEEIVEEAAAADDIDIPV